MTNLPPQRDKLDIAIHDFKRAVKRNMDQKRIDLMERWLINWSFYIKRESGFKPHENIKYHAGDIVTICYGFTVGSEQGGNRPSVVVEDNDHSDRTVMVVPLSSIAEGDDIYHKDVYLGELIDFNAATGKTPGTKSVAVINQMRAVSKQRIVRPTLETDSLLTLDQIGLQKIYNQITNLYTTASIRQQPQIVTQTGAEVAGSE